MEVTVGNDLGLGSEVAHVVNVSQVAVESGAVHGEEGGVKHVEFAMQCVANGEAIPADWTGTIATGSVKLTEINEQAAAPGTAEKLAEVQAALEDGSLKVFDTATFTVNGETLTEYLADVDDMGDFQPETNVISDGYFHESEFRSAPYFDIDIDGITNIDA